MRYNIISPLLKCAPQSNNHVAYMFPMVCNKACDEAAVLFLCVLCVFYLFYFDLNIYIYVCFICVVRSLPYVAICFKCLFLWLCVVCSIMSHLFYVLCFVLLCFFYDLLCFVLFYMFILLRRGSNKMRRTIKKLTTIWANSVSNNKHSLHGSPATFRKPER